MSILQLSDFALCFADDVLLHFRDLQILHFQTQVFHLQQYRYDITYKDIPHGTNQTHIKSNTHTHTHTNTVVYTIPVSRRWLSHTRADHSGPSPETVSAEAALVKEVTLISCLTDQHQI